MRNLSEKYNLSDDKWCDVFCLGKRAAVHRSVFDGQDKKLLKMRQEGKTLKQIGEYFGVGITAVLHRIQKLQSQNNQYQSI